MAENNDARVQELKENSGKYLYTYYDENGKKIGEGFLPYTKDTSSLKGQSVVPTSGGFWQLTNDYTIAPDASITLDEKTGAINVSAPQQLLDSEAFKNNFSKSVFEQLSSAYKRNPDYKVVDIFDESDEKKDITIPELIQKYDAEIKKYITYQTAISQERQRIGTGERGYSNRNDIANRLSEHDFIIMGTNAMGEGANDDSRIALPKWLWDDAKKYSSTFDEETGTVTKKDFRENLFSLVNRDENYINKMFDKAEDYFENDAFDDTEEYARNTALYDFISNNDPDATPFQVANYVVSSVVKGVGANLRETLLGLGNLVGTAMSFGGNVPGLGRGLKSITEYGLEKEEEVKKEAENFLDRMSTAGSVALGVGDVGTDIATILVPSAKIGQVAKAATKAKVATQLSKTAKAVSEAEKISAGAKAMVSASNAAEGAEIGKTAVEIDKMASRLGGTADIIAQSLSEAVISDPVVFAKLLQGQQTEGVSPGSNQDAYGYLLETAAWNIGGWTAFTVGAKGVKFASSTKAGRYINAVAQRVMAQAPVAFGALNEKILKKAYGENWLNGSKNAAKNAARKFNYNIRQQQKTIAKQKILSTEQGGTWENVLKQEKNIQDLVKLQNSTDNLQRAGRAYARTATNASVNPKLNGLETKLRGAADKITKMEKEAGLSTRNRMFRRQEGGSTKVSSTRVFSKESANYLGAKNQLAVLRNIKKVKGDLTDAQEKGEAILKKMLAASKKKLGVGLTKELDNYLSHQRALYKEFNNMRARQGALNAKQIEELREEGYWGRNGELYAPTYRVNDKAETKLVRDDGKVARDNDTSTEQYVWGSEKDFMDPELARYLDLMDTGERLAAKEYIDAMNSLPHTKAHVVHDAEEVARAARMKNIRTPLSKRIKNVTKGILKSGTVGTGDSAYRTLRLSRMREELIKQGGITESARVKLYKARNKKIPTTI